MALIAASKEMPLIPTVKTKGARRRRGTAFLTKVSTKDSNEEACRLLCQQLPRSHTLASVAHFIFAHLQICENYNQGYDTVSEQNNLGAAV